MTVEQISSGASCLECEIPDGLAWPILISLWAARAGVPSDAQTLVASARCLTCIPQGSEKQVLIYLLARLAGVTDVQQLIEDSKCYQCIPPGLEGSAMIFLTNQLT